MANTVTLTEEEKEHSKDIELLTTKPFLFVANEKFDLDKKSFAEHPSLAREGGLPSKTEEVGANKQCPTTSPASQGLLLEKERILHL